MPDLWTGLEAPEVRCTDAATCRRRVAAGTAAQVMAARAAEEEGWRTLLSAEQRTQLGTLWGKSNAGGKVNLLVQHLFDAMAVGELIWDRFMAPCLRQRLDDAAANGDGRGLYIWLCGLHDVGKASPAFQSLEGPLAARVQAAGLTWPQLSIQEARGWRHEKASGLVLRELLSRAWRDGGEHVDWIWPLAAGHHGVFPSVDKVHLSDRMWSRREKVHGADMAWRGIHKAIVLVVTSAAGYRNLAAAEPCERPSRADQLALSGFIVMADWLASDEHRFIGVDRLDEVSVEEARRRAGCAWRFLKLRGGWGRLPEPPADPVAARFGRTARPSQTMAVEAARAMPQPGLVVIEAPMGEGKTESALAAAEVLASRSGADGVFVAMPTQATSDPMFTRTRAWLRSVEPTAQIALVHGKRMFNEEWLHLVRYAAAHQKPKADEYGMTEDLPSVFSNVCEDGGEDEGDAGGPARWLLGRHRPLLASNGVGTIDQPLFAGTRTRYVMLRYAGLAGKVVVFDEVHAADTYMAQFLGEVLAWLGNGRVPVILLSATLAPGQRAHLARAYLSGALARRDVDVEIGAHMPGYPSVLTTWVDKGEPRVAVRSTEPWRASTKVEVALVEEDRDDSTRAVTDAVCDRLRDGGCALVIRNTVNRAQQTYGAVMERLGGGAVLLHGRFSAADRADLTERVLAQLGPASASRPHRLVVVATQIAEQSFDVDVDLLITDLAPADLLLQRAGRLHRHERPADARPVPVRAPVVLVTGLQMPVGGLPWFPPGSEAIYGRHHLLRSATLVAEAARGSGWSLPADVPSVVAMAYGDDVLVPDTWSQDANEAREKWDLAQAQQRAKAEPFLLAAKGHRSALTLEGLHTTEARDAESVVRVRDGEMGEEVVLVRRDERGVWALDGTWLGVNGEVGRDRPRQVLGGTVRFPSVARLGGLLNAVRDLKTLPEWIDHPWLDRCRVLELDGSHSADLGGVRIAYDREYGLTIETKG